MPKKYNMPEKISSMTIHHLYGIDGKENNSLKEYMEKNKYAFIADLLAGGFKKEEIEEAVNSEILKYAPWPKERRMTDLIWLNDKQVEAELDDLANKVTKFCGIEMNEPAYGNFASIGAELGSQQTALVGLIYAREIGNLYELDVEDSPVGPQYFNTKSIFAKMIFEKNKESD